LEETIGDFCRLRGYRVECCGKIDRHHLIDKSKLRGCKAAQKYVKANEAFFLVSVCNTHNAQTKLADTKAAQGTMWRQQVKDWGPEYCEDMLEGLRACFKGDVPEFRLEALLEA